MLVLILKLFVIAFHQNTLKMGIQFFLLCTHLIVLVCCKITTPSNEVNSVTHNETLSSNHKKANSAPWSGRSFSDFPSLSNVCKVADCTAAAAADCENENPLQNFLQVMDLLEDRSFRKIPCHYSAHVDFGWSICCNLKGEVC